MTENKTNQAIYYIKQYYNHKIDLETLHNKLLRVFKNIKIAVEFLYNYCNDAEGLR